MKERRPDEPEALWKEKDIVDGQVARVMVLIMRTNGCVWAKKGGCTMCGYKSASMDTVTKEDLLKQLDYALSKYKDEEFVKIYTSGSFLDENEIPADVRAKIFEAFSKCRRILFESRPEFIIRGVLETIPKTVTIALGLETCDNEITRASIRKGFAPKQSHEAGDRRACANPPGA